MTAQPPGIRHSALRVATHGKQVASLVVFYPSAEVQSAYSTAPADRATELGEFSGLGAGWTGLVAPVTVLGVSVVEAAGFFLWQTLARWPTCLQRQQCGRLPFTTIIGRSREIGVSGMARKPSLFKHTRKTSSLWAVLVAAGNWEISSALTRAAEMSPVRYAGTLQTRTRILRVPMYSGWSWNDLVAMQLFANLADCSSVGSDIPCRKTSTEVLAWDTSSAEDLLELILLQPS